MATGSLDPCFLVDAIDQLTERIGGKAPALAIGLLAQKDRIIWPGAGVALEICRYLLLELAVDIDHPAL